MNNQEFFEKAVRHCLTQNKQAQDGGRCQYSIGEGDNELRCAVGGVLSNDAITQIRDMGLMGSGIRDVLFYSAAAREELQGVSSDLIAAVQEVHDWHFPDGWSANFRKVALNWGLIFPSELA